VVAAFLVVVVSKGSRCRKAAGEVLCTQCCSGSQLLCCIIHVYELLKRLPPLGMIGVCCVDDHDLRCCCFGVTLFCSLA
jgi:hypothetical protein